MVKNCGDVIHHQVAARDILRDMVKIAKKNVRLPAPIFFHISNFVLMMSFM